MWWNLGSGLGRAVRSDVVFEKVGGTKQKLGMDGVGTHTHVSLD